MRKEYLKWEDIDITWENLFYLWEDIAIFEEIDNIVRRTGNSDYAAYVAGNPWDKLNKDIGEVKTDRVIKLWCQYNNIEYNKEKVIKDGIKVSASNFEKFVTESKNEISVKVSFQK